MLIILWTAREGRWGGGPHMQEEGTHLQPGGHGPALPRRGQRDPQRRRSQLWPESRASTPLPSQLPPPSSTASVQCAARFGVSRPPPSPTPELEASGGLALRAREGFCFLFLFPVLLSSPAGSL